MKEYLLTYTRKQQYSLIVGDIVVLFIAIMVSYSLRLWLNSIPVTVSALVERTRPELSIVILSHLLAMYLLDQYDMDRLKNIPKSLLMLVVSVPVGGFIASALLFFAPKYVFGREVLVIHIFVTPIFLLAWRSAAVQWLKHRAGVERLAVVGHGQIVSAFIEDVSRTANSGFTISSVCITREENSVGTCSSEGFLCRYHNVMDMLDSGKFDALVFDSTNGYFSNDEVRRILQLKFNGKAVYDLSTFYENLTGKVPLMYINGQWLLKSPELQGRVSLVYTKVKRLMDIVFALVLLTATSPLFLVTAILIKLNSEGPVFFVQERLGAHLKPFKCFKFRTMVVNAESQSGPVWAKEDDPRITRVGRILRKTRMDELPQLWNILKGDMTFVGPRPIRDYFARKLAQDIPFYMLRFCIKPGLTGWAQVSHDYAGSEEGQLEKFQYELFYIRNMSFILDLLTLLKTIRTVIKRTGQ